MKLVNMKESKDKKTSDIESMPAESSRYPYGLQISLDTDTLAKLGLDEMPKPGQKMMLMAIGEAVSVSVYKRQDGKENKNVSFQITDLALTPEGKKKSQEDIFYPEDKK